MCHFGDTPILLTWLAVFAMAAHFRASGNLKKCNQGIVNDYKPFVLPKRP